MVPKMSGTLIIVSAKTCSHCVSFYRDTYPSLIGDLKGVEVVEIKLENTSTPLDTSKYPASLAKYLRWFPMLILVPTANYRQAQQNRDTKIEAFIMNGRTTDTGAEFANEGYGMDKASIQRWISNTLAKPQFNSRSSIRPLDQPTSIKPLVPTSTGLQKKIMIPQGGDSCSGMVVKGW